MMSASLLVACLVSVAVATPYIVVNDFKCTPGGCASRATNTVRLALANSSQQRLLLQLVPPSTNLEAAETAWDPASRTFFTLLIDQTTGGGTLFSQRLNNNLTTGTLIAAVNVSLPAAAGGIVSFSVAGGVPLLLGQFGLVARVNPLTGSVVASFQAYSNTSLYLVGVSASTGGLLYTLASNNVGLPQYTLLAINPATMTATATQLGPAPRPNQWAKMDPFNMVWIPSVSRLLVQSTGFFDQLLFVDPTSGAVQMAVQDLSEMNLKFHQDPTNFHDDTWALAAYDNVTSTVYFAATEDSEGGGEVLVSVVLKNTKPWNAVNVVSNPFWTGLAGMQLLHST